MSLPDFLRPKPAERPLAEDRGLREKAPARDRRDAADVPQARRRGRQRWIFNGERPEPVPSYLGPVEDPEIDKLGICCSGGGIRSAAFSLGALQVLGEREQLRRAAYLAAVSGGSYIAAAISMVARAGPQDSNGDMLEKRGPFAQGSPEEQYLRNHCAYMAPTGSDMLYLGIRLVLGLLVNLAFISLPLIGAALVLTGFFYVPLVPDLVGPCKGAKCAANIPAWFWEVPLGLLGIGGLCGLATLLFRWRAEKWERFFVTWSTRLAILALGVALILVGLPYLVDWLDHLASSGESVKPSAFDAVRSISAGFLALLVGVLAQVGRLLLSKKGADAAGRTGKAIGKLGSGLSITLAYAAGGLIGPLLLLGVVALTIAAGMAGATKGSGVDLSLVGVGFGALALFGVLYYLVDLTTWSLHPFYKRRLSSAFALKRVSEDELSDKQRRRFEAVKVPKPPAPGDVVEDYAGIAIERDYDELVPVSQTAVRETAGDREWPTLLICAAANVSDPGASPPGRPVTSFTFSAHTVGGPLVGAVEMTELERAFENKDETDRVEGSRRVSETGVGSMVNAIRMGPRKHRRRDLTLPAAVAMSGAAISPSMGKMTPRPLTFLMALANLRLGVWVPNPRWVAAQEDSDKSLPRHYARPRLLHLFKEMLGRNRVDAKYLYVTDGGHYENLGLVELLRRGCTNIYCLDASGIGKGKAEYSELGEAISLARSELGVEIDFGDENLCDLKPDEVTQLAEKDVIEATIRYHGKFEGVKGTLIYVRNTMTAAAAWDARAHQLDDPRFPHNSTVDQLYTDKKFEAYRVLGAEAAGRAVDAMSA